MNPPANPTPRYPIHGILILLVVSIVAVLFVALDGRSWWRELTANSRFVLTPTPAARLGISPQQVDIYSEPGGKGTLVATYRMGEVIEQVEILETQAAAGLDWVHIRYVHNGAPAEGWVNKAWVFRVP